MSDYEAAAWQQLLERVSKAEQRRQIKPVKKVNELAEITTQAETSRARADEAAAAHEDARAALHDAAEQEKSARDARREAERRKRLLRSGGAGGGSFGGG